MRQTCIQALPAAWRAHKASGRFPRDHIDAVGQSNQKAYRQINHGSEVGLEEVVKEMGVKKFDAVAPCINICYIATQSTLLFIL